MSEKNIPEAEVIETDKGIMLTSPKGRKILYKELTLEEELDVTCAVEEDRAGRISYIQSVIIAASIREIDGKPCQLPSTEAQVRAMLKRVDKDGIVAVFQHLSDERKKSEGGNLKNS